MDGLWSLCVCFCFKQKTAYEMRISDWSSDVCSSDLLEGAETLHRALLGTAIGVNAAAVIYPEHLPLPARSVDALSLPHTLEFSSSPHTVLRETARVLNDRGRLFVLGYSPWGWPAWRERLGLRPRGFPSGARFYSASRVNDWLQLLDFDIADVRHFGSGFPWLAPRSSSHPWTPEIGRAHV